MVQKSGDHQLRLAVYPHYLQGSIHLRWLARFLPSTVLLASPPLNERKNCPFGSIPCFFPYLKEGQNLSWQAVFKKNVSTPLEKDQWWQCHSDDMVGYRKVTFTKFSSHLPSPPFFSISPSPTILPKHPQIPCDFRDSRVCFLTPRGCNKANGQNHAPGDRSLIPLDVAVVQTSFGCKARCYPTASQLSSLRLKRAYPNHPTGKFTRK